MSFPEMHFEGFEQGKKLRKEQLRHTLPIFGSFSI